MTCNLLLTDEKGFGREGEGTGLGGREELSMRDV